MTDRVETMQLGVDEVARLRRELADAKWIINATPSAEKWEDLHVLIEEYREEAHRQAVIVSDFAEKCDALRNERDEAKAELESLDLSAWGPSFRKLVAGARTRAGYWDEDNMCNREANKFFRADLTHADKVICDLEEMIVGEMAELRDCIVRNVFYRKRCLAFAKERDDFREKAERWEDEAMAGTGRAMILSEEIVRHNKNWATASKEAQEMLKENAALRKDRDSWKAATGKVKAELVNAHVQEQALRKRIKKLEQELNKTSVTEDMLTRHAEDDLNQIAALKAARDAMKKEFEMHIVNRVSRTFTAAWDKVAKGRE